MYQQISLIWNEGNYRVSFDQMRIAVKRFSTIQYIVHYLVNP